MAEIRVSVSPKGEVLISVDGVKGQSCKELTASLEKAMGKPTNDTETGEYFETPITNQNFNQQ